MNKHEFHSLVDAMEKDINKLYVEISAIDDVEVLLDLGDEFADKPEFGVRFYDRVIAVDPTNLRAVLSAGACYLLAGNDLDAYYMLRRAREIDPTHEDVKKLAASVLSPTSRLPRDI